MNGFINEGSITDYVELGDTKVFKMFPPNCLIWRWENNKEIKERLIMEIIFNCKNGQIWFGSNKKKSCFKRLFDIKVVLLVVQTMSSQIKKEAVLILCVQKPEPQKNKTNDL